MKYIFHFNSNKLEMSCEGPAGPKKTLFCFPTDELLRVKDDLLSEEGQSLSSLTAQVV